ncbi:MAG: MinD/ParA family protein [Eubacteriales bacterium]|jgi:flagellar biosynthesis protein FlhG|nr:MinD/ParA family protein [Bacillota bacterium]MBV1727743.1 MinD/ParA family protein [Desulforudis sp.]MDZ4042059.1 MinD/ParA family protein [Eubacteriales bacterium]MBU4532805.1 MinD/ParA family protein [Bacillota bacterium]MBU4554133.1 MinD/ParA family protein [Bacillota bacterium]
MRDQAYKLRILANRQQPEQATAVSGPRVIAITSGKGGVGKTNISVNLGLALAMMGKRVVLFDADLGLANGEVLLGVAPKYSLFDALFGDKAIEDIVVTAPYKMRLISGGSGIQELANLDRAQQARVVEMLSYFKDSTDYLLIDTGAGINKSVLGFLAASQEVLVVVTPEPTSLTDAYSLIKVLSRYKLHDKVYLVVNRVTGDKDAQQAARKIKLVAKKFLGFNIEHIGSVAEDAAVLRAVRNQQPFIIAEPNAGSSKSVEQLARLLANEDLDAVKSGAIDGFFGRLMRLFG